MKYSQEVVEFATYHNISETTSYEIVKNCNARCKCGKFRKLKTNKSYKSGYAISVYCGDKMCHPRFGIKRPEHSNHMRQLASSGTNEKFNATLIKPGELFNKEVNTLEFKKKKLKNKGFVVDELTDEEILALERKYESEKQHTRESIARSVLKFIEKHSLEKEFEYPSYEYIIGLSTEELKNIKYRKYSWHNFLYCASRCSKNYVRDTIYDCKYNIRGLTVVKTKSSYESNHIRFFEENNIKWDYEPIRLIWNEISGATYTPDFIFEYNSKRYILETKGFLAEDYKNEYLTTRINTAFDYALTNGYNGMIISFDSKPKNIEDLIKQKMKVKY